MRITISTGSISIHGIAQLVFLLLIRWVMIYPTDSAIQRLNNWALVDSAMAIFSTVNRDKFRSSTNFIFHNYEVQWTNFSVFCLLVCFFSLLFFRSSSLPALVIRINNSWIMTKWDRVACCVWQQDGASSLHEFAFRWVNWRQVHLKVK